MTDRDRKVSCRFGSERFDVYSDAQVCALFEQEFGDVDPPATTDVIFRISRHGHNRPASSDSTQSGPGGQGIGYSNRYCNFVIRFGSPLQVDVKLKRSAKMTWAGRLPVFAQRMLTRKFNSVDEQEYGYLVYKAVLWILFLHSVSSSRLFLHASGFARNGRCVLLSGTGGVGKTSLSAKILAAKDTLFVSDDIVSVDPAGVAYANGMFVHVYPYNNLEASLPFLRRKGPMGWVNRCHWYLRKALLGSKGACRRISPFEVHGCGAAAPTGTDLASIVWLSRDGTSESGIRRADGHEFVQSHLPVLRDEMRSAFEFYSRATQDGWNPQQDGMPADLDQAVVDGLTGLVANVPVLAFNVAENRSAAQNAEALLAELDLQ